MNNINKTKVSLNLDDDDDDDDDDDQIDEDDLLMAAGDDGGMLAPPPAIDVAARAKAAADDCGGRKACDNCSCGRAEMEAAEQRQTTGGGGGGGDEGAASQERVRQLREGGRVPVRRVSLPRQAGVQGRRGAPGVGLDRRRLIRYSLSGDMLENSTVIRLNRKLSKEKS